VASYGLNPMLSAALLSTSTFPWQRKTMINKVKEMTVDLQPTILVVDDDPGVSRAMKSVGQLLDLPVQSFSSAREFLSNYHASQPGCLILDIKMPGMSGLELQQELVERGIQIPIIMISGHADVRIAVDAMNRGAVTLLEKPCRLDELTSYIRSALKTDQEYRESQNRQQQTQTRLAQLTPKESEVFDLIAAGKTNREIAELLHLSVRAIEDRRSRLMKKLVHPTKAYFFS
jgi:RNA polymerase sigma factor (sigma-70 family)